MRLLHAGSVIGHPLSAACAVLLLVLAGLGGCADTSRAERDDPAMQGAKTQDPASANAVQANAAQAMPGATAGAASNPTRPIEPLKPQRRDGQIYFPQTGWLDEASFWATYNTEPQLLPADLDLVAVHHLKQAYLAESARPTNSTGQL